MAHGGQRFYWFILFSLLVCGWRRKKLLRTGQSRKRNGTGQG
ncbi:MAG: GlyGly-CTERM sorting domain-containing protein [Firmicutes bacterium]|nr:GlyGly-CTERM sorting domain-containing protein [Bacillota bacterium]